MRRRAPTALLATSAALLVAACASKMPPAVDRGGEVITTAGPNRSMIYAIEAGDGIALVDLGWWGADGQLRARLARLERDSADVAAVFLTHAHRDHIAGWRSVRHATFYMAQAEVPAFFGEAEYGGWIPRLADRLHAPRLPARGVVDVVAFSRDTAIIVGGDTVRVFLVPGHTSGSAAYLVRGVLFAGDAIGYTPVAGFQSARPGFSDDTERAAASLASLYERVAPYDVDAVCTAHARCSAFTAAFRTKSLADHTPPPGAH